MPREHSFGAVIFRQPFDGTQGKYGEAEYLLLRYRHGKFDFSRGHAERGEQTIDTVRREIKEETGIEDLEFIPGFRETVSWFFKREGKVVYKEATFLLARTKTKEVKLSEEHLEYRWANYEEATKILELKNSRIILDKAHNFLAKK